MAYAGLPPATFSNNLTNVQLIDDISGSFNGSTQTFALTTNSSPFHAVSARSLIVVLGGIVQKPQVDYTVDGTNITFTIAPVSGLTFAARNIYGLNYLNNVNDGVLTPAKLSTGGPTWTSAGNLTVSGDLNVTGSFNSGTQGLFWQDNEPANFGNDNDLKIFHNGSASFIQDTGTGPLYIEGNELIVKQFGSGTTYATFNSTGVGIGTTNPTEILDILSGNVPEQRRLKFGIDSTTASSTIYCTESGGYNRTLSIGGSDILFLTDGGGVTTRTQKAIINSSGNVGIGTTNPTAKLDILAGSGTTALLISNNAALSFVDSSATARRAALVSASNNFYYGDVDNATTGSNLFLLAKSSITFFNNGVSNITISASGNLTPEADATQNLGASNKRWANIYSADLQLSNEGSQNDVDGTWGQYTIQEGENDLFLLNRRNGKKYKFVLQEVN